MIWHHISLYGIWWKQEAYDLAPLQDTVDIALLISRSSFLFYRSPCVLFVLKSVHAYEAEPFQLGFKCQIIGK